ncbi:transposase [Methylomicrobium sp. RS1]|uniref:transposase n=1 Tax=Candidatus Methylomicrobium oryzae TaxID=2802053 RepID=UPI0023517D2D|nr:transposase [Methylomicrobium sp. RS1]
MNRYRTISERVHGGYQLVWVPKRRMKVVFIGGNLRRYLGNFLNEPAKQNSIFIVEGNVLNDPYKGYYSGPKKHAQPRIVGYLKGNGTLEINRNFKRNQKPGHEKSYSANRYAVSAADSANRLSDKEYFDDYGTEEAYFAKSGWM